MLASLTAVAFVAACGGGGGGGTTTSVAGSNVAMAVNATTGAVITQTFNGDPLVFASGINAGGMSIPGPATLTITDTGGNSQSFSISAAGGVTATGAMSYGSCKFTITASTIPGVVVGTTYTITTCNLEVTSSGTRIGDPATVDAIFDLGGFKASPRKKSILVRTDGTVAVLVGNSTINLPTVQLTVKTVSGT
ncbi:MULTISPECIES: hypothetical protein [Ramlibacter]|uniref:Uncharacterized protein n=1 Tax=Ramlibacter pinisoli TaxID=2682844 RepID=A0A6N8IT64_9BURK|nr:MULTISPECIES: hypothetical protein [Ramlibacter]MBA2964810.1 hypothetical protein [Ramlibacter sp. CGMCC 1.13660]MVQ29775.1 hypothetical protein [Ramlibacter pinisoli]